ncbi:MAG: hypothetical protein Q9170_006220 [Blastenia crenularia]
MHVWRTDHPCSESSKSFTGGPTTCVGPTSHRSFPGARRRPETNHSIECERKRQAGYHHNGQSAVYPRRWHGVYHERRSSENKGAVNEPPSAPDLTCSNQGFEYTVFASTNPDGTQITIDNQYASYKPETFKTAKPEVVGKTKSIGINDPTKIYDSTRASGEYVTVNHRAYLFTQEAGEYTFALPPGDNISLLWTGPEAYSGYTRANAKVERVFGAPPMPDYKQSFKKGEYVPIRIMWANGPGPGEFSAEIKAPDGSVIIGAGTTKESPYLIGFSCDHTTAPKFLPYGAES